MRRFILALTIAIPIFARADFGPDTIHDNIPGDATVGDILTVGGAVRQQQVDQTLARFAETGTVSAATNAQHAAEADHAYAADEADLATRALSANEATIAGYAARAGFATNAQHAAEADRAGTADEADLATRALSADAATIAGYATGALNATNAQHATVAEHANVADEATEAYHAETATRATTADHAAEADVAYRYIEVDLATNAMYAAEAGHATNAEHAVNASYATEAEYATNAEHAAYASIAGESTFAETAHACETCVSYVYDDDRTEQEQGQARQNIGLDEEWMKTLWSYAGFAAAGVRALAGNSEFNTMISTNVENYVYSPTYLGWLGVYVDERSYTSILGAWDDEDFVEKANAWGDERYAKAADTNAVHYTEDLGKTEEQKAQARQNIGADESSMFSRNDFLQGIINTILGASPTIWVDGRWMQEAENCIAFSSVWAYQHWQENANNWISTKGFLTAETDPEFTAWRGSAQFTNDVLGVGLNIDTNDVAAIGAMVDIIHDFPIDPTTGATTLGTLLAAFAAALAWLKKNKVQTVKLNDGSIEKAADGGVVKLDDFFRDTNTLLKATIDGELPIPLEEKTGNVVAADGHAYAVTMSAGITLTMPTVPNGNTDALIFQCRFSNSTSGDLNVTFDPSGNVIKFDGADCGIVKAGKAALLSAMWNGEAWDLVWKNQA